MKSIALSVALAASITGCAHKQMSNSELARSTVMVGAAVVITGAVVYAEYRSQSGPELPNTTSAALPPGGAR